MPSMKHIMPCKQTSSNTVLSKFKRYTNTFYHGLDTLFVFKVPNHLFLPHNRIHLFLPNLLLNTNLQKIPRIPKVPSLPRASGIPRIPAIYSYYVFEKKLLIPNIRSVRSSEEDQCFKNPRDPRNRRNPRIRRFPTLRILASCSI